MHATTLKGNMGYDQYTVSNDCSCRTYFCCFLLALTNVCPWPLVPFFQISLENRADKTTHNTFRDCRVPFFRQPFSKQLYVHESFIRTGMSPYKVLINSGKFFPLINISHMKKCTDLNFGEGSLYIESTLHFQDAGQLHILNDFDLIF